MTNENEHQLDDHQLSSLYKQAEKDMPPAHLDESILTASKQSSSARPINPFSNNWRVPASMAAVLIISIGVVTLMEIDILPVNTPAPQAIAPIHNEIQSKHEQLALRDKTATLSSLTADIGEMKIESSSMQQALVAKQTKSKQRLARSMKSSPKMASSSAIPDIKSISTLRLAGKKTLANKQADLFIRHYFGNELIKVDPAKVVLSTKDWKDIISELRMLDRESIAIKLEELLEKHLEN